MSAAGAANPVTLLRRAALLAGLSRTAALADLQPNYTYSPGTPTPRDLSISRT